jgi:uncharacterized iron-regulated membrane protein
MQLINTIHRWAGGLIGLLFVMFGLSGSLLVFRDAYLRATLPSANDAYIGNLSTIAAATERLLSVDGDSPASILFAHSGLGGHRLFFGEGKGAFADQAGNIVERWSSVWERPDLWLFDLHAHLLAGQTGATVAGIVGLIGIGFIVTGTILWWRTRRTFELRAFPKRMSRPAIVRHHRDLGIVVAPLMFLSMITGSVMVLPPVKALLLSPFSSRSDMLVATSPPKVKGGVLAVSSLNWRSMFAQANARFPGAEPRILTLPREPGGLVSLRLRQAAEWAPNGSTTVWFDPQTGAVAGTRDATTMPLGLRIFELSYPLHAAKVGGLAFELATAVMGLALTMLGIFTSTTFWFTKTRRRPTSGRHLDRSGGSASANSLVANTSCLSADITVSDKAICPEIRRQYWQDSRGHW